MNVQQTTASPNAKFNLISFDSFNDSKCTDTSERNGIERQKRNPTTNTCVDGYMHRCSEHRRRVCVCITRRPMF